MKIYNFTKKELKNINKLCDSINDMAMSRADAIERCHSLGKKFIQHFDKIYKNPNSDNVNHWMGEMQGWLNSVNEIKLKSTNERLLKSELRDWFFTATADASDFMKSPPREEVEAYDNFVDKVSINRNVKLSIKEAIK